MNRKLRHVAFTLLFVMAVALVLADGTVKLDGSGFTPREAPATAPTPEEKMRDLIQAYLASRRDSSTVPSAPSPEEEKRYLRQDYRAWRAAHAQSATDAKEEVTRAPTFEEEWKMKADKRQINARLRKGENRQPSIVKLPLLLTIVVAVVVISCFGQTLASDGSEAEGMTTLTSFDASLMQLPESITVDSSGNFYLSMSPLREIWKLDADGNFMEVVASFSLEPGLFGVSGLSFDPDGNLYVAIWSTKTDMNGVWKIAPDGAKERIAGTGGISLPNDLAVASNSTLYMTDSAGAIWRYKPGGQAEVWIQHESLKGAGETIPGIPLVGANGIVVTPGEQAGTIGTVIVSNTDKGQLVSIPILPDGSAGEPEIVIAAPTALYGLDGITTDAEGNIYATVNGQNKIVRISPDGSELIELASGAPLDTPTSLVFGTGTEQNTLFIANFPAFNFFTDPPTPEKANPAVIALNVEP